MDWVPRPWLRLLYLFNVEPVPRPVLAGVMGVALGRLIRQPFAVRTRAVPCPASGQSDACRPEESKGAVPPAAQKPLAT
jgi:hypothetical protein